MVKKIVRIAGLALALSLVSSVASARGIIKQPGHHLDYGVEIEPHLILGHPFRPGDAGGPGVRFSIPIVDNGFIKKINNSVAIGFGLDYFAWGYRTWRRRGGYWGNYGRDTVWLPVVMQWNFYLHEKWSVFGEPGLAARLNESGRRGGVDYIDPFVFFAGGRFHFTKDITLTMRLGFPVGFSVGVSFML